MGYNIKPINGGDMNQYLGSPTMMSLAHNGAFDCEVSQELQDLANTTEGIMAIVDANGVDHFLRVAKSGNCHGNWLQQVIKVVEENYMDGFIVVY